MIAGGFDDISEEGSYEFANMKATSNAGTEFAMGREPTEMSRPATASRAGFPESQVFRTSTSNKHAMLTVDEGCSYCDECEDCTGTWCSNSWYPCFHIYLHVRLPSFLISQSSLSNFLVTKQVTPYLRLGAALSLLRDKSLQSNPSPILDVASCSRQLSFRRSQISQRLPHEHALLQEEIGYRKAQGMGSDGELLTRRGPITNF